MCKMEHVAPYDISIVIPFVNEEKEIALKIPYFLSLKTRFRELIFVDGGSTDAGKQHLEDAGFHVVSAPQGRASQMNVGAVYASGSHLLFLHVDTQLPELTHQDYAALLESEWGFFLVRLSNPAWPYRILASGINFRSKTRRVGSGDQALFVRRERFFILNGFPNIALMEDITLARLLRKQHAPVIITNPVVTSSRRWETGGVVKVMLLMWSLQILYALGVSPNRLARWYGYRSKTDKEIKNGNKLECKKLEGKSSALLIQLTKTPIVGEVKTRLMPALGGEGACQLHQEFTRFIANRFSKLSDVSFQLWSSKGGDFITGLANQLSIQHFIQQGNDLGARILNCIESTLCDYSKVIFIGSDCPFLTKEHIRQVNRLLDSCDVVFIPATDGGYVLVGVKEKNHSLFEDMPWGTSRVLEESINRLEREGYSYKLLAPLSDIDRPEDLKLLNSIKAFN